MTIKKTKLLVSFMGLVFLFFFSQLKFPEMKNLTVGYPLKIVSYISVFVSVFAFIIFTSSLKDLLSLYSSFGRNFNYLEYRSNLEQIRGKSHLKILVYMLLAIYFFYCVPAKKLRAVVNINLGLAIIFDFISGTRTTMFLIILYLYVLTVRIKKKSYIVPVMLLGGLVLFSSEVVRSIGLNPIKSNSTASEKILLGIGEFNNTLVTLPYILEGNLEKNYDIVDVISWGNFIPPLIRFFNNPSLGDIYQNSINRGIGYASNIISNWYFVSGGGCIFIIPLFFLFFIYIDEKTENGEFFLIKVLMICFIRNFMREGVASFMAFLYIFFIYFGLFVLFNRKNRRLVCINYQH